MEGSGLFWPLDHKDRVIVPVDAGFALNSFAEKLGQCEHAPVRFPVVVAQGLVDALIDGGINFRFRPLQQRYVGDDGESPKRLECGHMHLHSSRVGE